MVKLKGEMTSKPSQSTKGLTRNDQAGCDTVMGCTTSVNDLREHQLHDNTINTATQLPNGVMLVGRAERKVPGVFRVQSC
jgi:hypothetical protein